MLKTRGRKILGDILARKGRTALVAISIMIGVFGITTLTSLNDLIVSQLKEDLKAEGIAMTHVYVVSPGGEISAAENETYLQTLEALPGVNLVEGQAVYVVSWQKANTDDPDAYEDGFILAYTEPFGEIQLEPVSRVVEGRYPVNGENEIAVEQRFAKEHGVAVGDKLVFRELDSDAATEWEIVGLVFHPYFTISVALQSDIGTQDSIFTTYDNAQRIADFAGLSSLYARYDTVDEAKAGLNSFMQTVSSQTPYVPVFSYVDDPENNYILSVVSDFANVLNILAVLAMVVSGFLVTNVINSIVVEQKRQIGVMKSLGASRWDNIFIYAGMALVYGVMGTILGVLLAVPVASAMAVSLAPLALTYLEGFNVSSTGLLIGVIMGLLVPVLAALIPVYNGTRVSVLEAMTDFGISSDWGKTRFSRLIGALPVPVTMRQALSNISQKKGRLALTGITLTLAVAAFTGVTAVFTGLTDTLNSAFETFNFEITLNAQETQNFDAVRNLLLENVDAVEEVYPGYGVSIALEGYESTDPLTLGSNQLPATGIDPASPVIKFDLEEGAGWQDDPTRRGVVITRNLADNLEKNLGDTVVVTVGSGTYEFEIIGIDRYPFPVILFDWKELATIAGFTDEEGQPLTNTFYIGLVGEPDAQTVSGVIDTINAVMTENGIQATYQNQPELSDELVQQFNAFNMIFNISSGVMAAVGAIGLLATLSMAVFERQKEIGVMRSIGAGSGTIVSQFLVEGILVGFIAWVIAIPLGYFLGSGLSTSLGFGDAFVFSYPPSIVAVGLVGILTVAAVASIWPSLSAARKTVSDILRYQ